MRILFVSLLEAHWGGSEMLWTRTAHRCLARGHAVGAFFAYYKDLPPIQELRAAGVTTGYGTPPPTRWWKRLGRPTGSPTERFLAFLDQWRPDLVLFSQGALLEGVEHMNLCAGRGLPYAVLNQLVAPWHDAARWPAARAAFGGARRIWFVSQENLASARGWLGAELPQAEVTPNIPSFTAPPAPWPAETPHLRLACVGRLDPRQKGQDLVIDALALDPARWHERGLRVSFFGAGEDGPVLEARARAANVPVDFPGFAASPAEIWRTHHGLLLSSRYEGQALAMLEAMLQARPVFVTPVGGTGGLIRPGHNGLLARSIDVAGLADLLEAAWQQRARWPELGRQAAADAQAWLSGDPAERLAGHLEAMVGSGGTSA